MVVDFNHYLISSLAEAELRYHAGECRNCQQVVRGYEIVAKHMQNESSLLEDQVGSATDGVLENLKKFRDLLVSFRVMYLFKKSIKPSFVAINIFIIGS